MVKKFSKIKYPMCVEFDDENNQVYIATTENWIYIIDGISFEIIKRYKINVKTYLNKVENDNFELVAMAKIKESKYMVLTAMTIGKTFIIKSDICNEHSEIIYESKFDFYLDEIFKIGLKLCIFDQKKIN